MHKHGFSADLLKAASSILNGEEPIEEKMSSKEKMKKGLYNDNSNDKSDDGEGMDKVQPKALKKKFDDRKDKDIDNDGDQDSSDEYLHNKRKAISKSMKEDTVDEVINHDPKHVKQAIGIASDPRYKQGNMTGAVKAMNKISPGLNKHPQVAAVLRKQNEAVDLDTKNVDKALKHDCATHIVHEKWGNGQCIPGMHTLEQISEEEGIVTHYDVLFDHGIEESVSVKEMKIIKSMNHGHPKKKNK